MFTHRAWVKLMVAGAVLTAVTVAGGCGGMKGQGDGQEARVVVLRGKVSSHGSTPFSLLLLESSDGKVYSIEPGEQADELRALADMDVSVRARVIPKAEDQYPGLEVLSYDLLALPTGEVPIVGTIRSGGLIEDSNMVMWIIEGDFAAVLKTFVGSKVWIVGVTQESRLQPDGMTYKVILVTEYGVIRS